MNLPFNKNSVVAAPMAGYTDSGFRRMCRKYGADCTVSEMISSKGIFYNDNKTEILLKHTPEEEPFIIQIFGNDTECMKYAADYVCRRHSPVGVDINMGCPAPKIFQNGDGCALMGNLEKAREIISAVKENSDVPVSVKFRSGIDESSINAVEFAQMCQHAGASFITVHARTRKQFYSGQADLEIIKKVVNAVSIPVIANGDITDRKSALRMLSYTGAHSIMVGRGALGNPTIFSEIKKADYKKPQPFQLAEEHLLYTIEDKGEFQAVREFRKQLIYYLRGNKNASKLKLLCCNAVTLSDCREIFRLAEAER